MWSKKHTELNNPPMKKGQVIFVRDNLDGDYDEEYIKIATRDGHFNDFEYGVPEGNGSSSGGSNTYIIKSNGDTVVPIDVSNITSFDNAFIEWGNIYYPCEIFINQNTIDFEYNTFYNDGTLHKINVIYNKVDNTWKLEQTRFKVLLDNDDINTNIVTLSLSDGVLFMQSIDGNYIEVTSEMYIQLLSTKQISIILEYGIVTPIASFITEEGFSIRYIDIDNSIKSIVLPLPTEE